MKIKISKIKDALRKFPWWLAEHTFLTLIGLIILALILGGLIFYKYSILAKSVKPEIPEKLIQFKEKTYQKILEEWEVRQKKVEEADIKTYPDLFRL